MIKEQMLWMPTERTKKNCNKKKITKNCAKREKEN